jgi:hypothetical protein
MCFKAPLAFASFSVVFFFSLPTNHLSPQSLMTANNQFPKQEKWRSGTQPEQLGH